MIGYLPIENKFKFFYAHLVYRVLIFFGFIYCIISVWFVSYSSFPDMAEMIMLVLFVSHVIVHCSTLNWKYDILTERYLPFVDKYLTSYGNISPHKEKINKHVKNCQIGFYVVVGVHFILVIFHFANTVDFSNKDRPLPFRFDLGSKDTVSIYVYYFQLIMSIVMTLFIVMYTSATYLFFITILM